MQPINPYPLRGGKEDELNALIGKSLGHFEIVERIGSGGMATVFKAHQPTLDRFVAVKVLPLQHAHSPVFVKRFVQEARSVAKLTHPNIVQIHDFGEQDGIMFIVMEYVDGGTLKDRLKQRALSVVETMDFVIQAAEGLNYAHRHNIIHRDVKPANMLVRKDGHLLLSDFGIAKILESTNNLTEVGTGIGTPQYMSPEQGTGQPTVDARSDIYSLGIVLFHCLTGRVPFVADSPLSITMKHLREPLPVEYLQRMSVPAAIEQVTVKMTAKAPADRYQSTDALIDALTAAVAAANLTMPRPWRSGIGSLVNVPGPKESLPQLPANRRPSNPGLPPEGPTRPSAPDLPQQAMVTVSCFRCGSANPSNRLFCTTCGYELADSKASVDRYTGPNGRPLLACLTIQGGPMGGRSFRFHQDVATIGRTNGNELIIAGRTVSRWHARLWFDKGYWYVTDLESANGTFVNGMRLQPKQSMQLNDGDRINLGDEVVIFNIIY